ncbi:hypothetical protein [Borreliella bavariensis]|uniref:hypothetical protein n=1 Tax=Borreliella bavariensis TaxID=664662 RepID=UPI001BFFE9F5|nr:hypothetical protein [Borreliella bavariensis]
MEQLIAQDLSKRYYHNELQFYINNRKDNNKIKNSIENFSKKIKQKNTLNNAKQEKEKLRFSYKKSFEEYQENKLTKKYKISLSYLIELKRAFKQLDYLQKCID